MKTFFDRTVPFGFVREQTFDSVPVTVRDVRALRAAELLRDAQQVVADLQRDYGHLAGVEVNDVTLRIEQEISELIRKLRNLRG